MALGTNYKRIDDKESRNIRKSLDIHYELTQRFIKEGMSSSEASKKAYKIVTGKIKS